MTNKRNYSRLRDGKSEGSGLAADFVNEEEQKSCVPCQVFVYPANMVIPTWLKFFTDN